MDALWGQTSGHNAAAVILAFLQADCRNAEYGKELLSLGQEIRLTRDINCNGPGRDDGDDGGLETDGHLPSCMAPSLQDLQPSVDLQWPGNREEAAALLRVAEELREIAAQLEHNVVARATQNLSRNISTSPSEQWKDHLNWEVERVMRQGVCMGMEHLPRERIFVALTLTLVKGVCEQAPRLLRTLFATVLQYFTPARTR